MGFYDMISCNRGSGVGLAFLVAGKTGYTAIGALAGALWATFIGGTL